MKYKLLDKQREFLSIPHNENLDVAIYQGGFTCKKGNAEYLSPIGWKRIDTLTTDDLMAVYHPEDKSIKFEHPKEVFCWNADKWYEIHTRTLHQINCPNHRMYTIKNGKEYIQSMDDFYKEHQKSKNGHCGKFVTTFTQTGISTGLTEKELRLLVAFQADGTKHEYNGRCNVKFHFSKQRKIDRLKDLLVGYYYEEKIYADNDTYIYADLPVKLVVKRFYNSWYQLDSKELKIIVDECKYWDGSEGKTHNCYYTSDKNNADFMQFAGTISGYRTTIFARTKKSVSGSGKDVTEYRVNFNKNTTPALVAPRNKAEIKVTEALPNEKKYCPSTSTKLWICREFNKITVTGNSGKTWCGSFLGILLANKYPGCRGLVGAKEYELVRKTTLVSYLEHLDALGYKAGKDYTYNKVDKIIKFKNGSEILFLALDDPEKFKSLDLHWAEIEEASQISESSFNQLIGRLRNTKRGENWKNFRYRLFGHTNPQADKGWIYEKFVEKKLPYYRLIIAPTTNNIYLPEHFIKSMKESFDPEYYKINVLGEFGDYNSGLVVKNFTEENIKELNYCEKLPVHLTCDFNVNPMCWSIAHKDRENVYFFDEIVIENTTTEQCIKEFIRKYPKKDAEIIINGDASGDNRSTQSQFTNYAIMRKVLRDNGYTNFRFELRDYNPPILSRVSAFNARVKNADGYRHLFVDKKCKYILHNVHNLKYKEGTSIIDVPTIVQLRKNRDDKFLSHMFDAVSYLVEYYWRIK